MEPFNICLVGGQLPSVTDTMVQVVWCVRYCACARVCLMGMCACLVGGYVRVSGWSVYVCAFACLSDLCVSVCLIYVCMRACVSVCVL